MTAAAVAFYLPPGADPDPGFTPADASAQIAVRALRPWRIGAAVSGLARSAFLACAVFSAVCSAGPAQAGEGCSPSRIDLRPPAASGQGEAGQGERQSFTVEIADTAETRARGLMYRESMAADAGMLFIYDSPRFAEFWMKNTLIPLDIIFADASGRVQVVHENAIPGDETPIPGGTGVLYVLEINGGLARKTGIVAGSEMRHPRITDGAWPCP